MKNDRIKKYLKTRVELKLFEKKNTRVLKIIWKLKSWKLNFKIGILKNYLKIGILKIEILKIYLRIEFLKLI